jgi:peptide chain release factor 2
MLQELGRHKGVVELWTTLQDKLQEAEFFAEMAAEEGGTDLAEVDKGVKELEKILERAETQALLSGEYDASTAILTIHSGSGGDDAQDWAQMLLRMYLRWGADEGLKMDLVETSHGEHGIHSATIVVSGDFPYGMLRSERGVHRLVRISPFDSAKRRHTSFAKVDVVPELEKAREIEIRSEDLKVDTYRSSGAGGQHVNKTDSAVRLTHLPTGVVVACQNERSQHANRDTAMRLLKAKLFEMQVQQRKEHLSDLRGENTDAAWGYQIRNYVLHPYSIVKDRRTGAEDSNVQAVLDGRLHRFITAYLEACVRLGREPLPGEGGGEED